VRIKSHNIKLRSNWLRKPFSASACRSWLAEEGSLTARLKSRHVDFHVKTISQKDAKPFVDEAAVLKRKHSATVSVRDVLLICKQQPLVYAHSVLPHSSLRGAWAKLGKLGNKPLGEILFSDPRVKRTLLSYKKLSKHHALYRKAVVHLPQAPTYLWARRSTFSLKSAKILVTEVFLPALSDKRGSD